MSPRAPGTDPRRVVVEDRAESLADQLALLGDRARAERLRTVLAGAGAATDAHLPALRDALADVAGSGLPATVTGPARRVLEAIDDLPAALGVRGSVWVAWQHVGYATTWLGPVGPLEHGPSAAPLPVALAWARRRARVVLLRPEFSPGTWYSVGVQDDGRHPRLELG